MFRAILLLTLSGAASGRVPAIPLSSEAELERFLKRDLCTALKADGNQVSRLLTESILATGLEPNEIVPIATGPWSQEEVRFSSPKASASAAAWSRSLEAYFRPIAIRSRCSVGFHRLSFGRTRDEAEAAIDLLVAGTASDGSRIMDSGEVRVRLSRSRRPSAWRIDQLDLGPRTRVRAPFSRFLDVTEAAGLPRDFKESEVVLRLDSIELADALDRGGLAVADVNGDGYPDIFVVADGASLLFLSKGDGTYEEAAKRVGLAHVGNGRGAVFADLDGDGDLDLVVANKARGKAKGEVVVYRNEGGRFERAFAVDAPPDAEYMHIAVADVDGDGKLDLHVAAYGSRNLADLAEAGRSSAGLANRRAWGARANDLLDAVNGAADLLLINQGDLHFINRAEEWGVADHGWTLASTLVDLDGDGFPELICADDFGRKRLYRNDGGKRFVDVSDSSGLGAERANGMGIAVADVDGDGQLDIYFANMHSNAGLRLARGFESVPEVVRKRMLRAASGNTLWLGRGNLAFQEAGVALGVGDGGWAYGVTAFDAADDGHQALFSPCGYFTGKREDDY